MRIIIELNKDQVPSVVQQYTSQISDSQERSLDAGMPSASLLEERGRDSAYPATNNGSMNAGTPTQDLLTAYSNGNSGNTSNSAQIIDAGLPPAM